MHINYALNHPRGAALVSALRNRTFHWRRNTENFDQYDYREQAAAVLQGGEYKLVTTGEDMCVYRMYHLRSDPKERHNILATRQDPLPAFDLPSITARLATTTSSSTSNSNTAAAQRRPTRHTQLPAHVDACNGHNVRTAGTDGIRGIETFFDVTVLAKIGKCSSANSSGSSTSSASSVAACVHATGRRVLDVMTGALPSLRAFVTRGNAGHAQYMSSQRERNICAVPLASQVPPLRFPQDAWPHDGGLAPQFAYANVSVV